MTLPDSRDEKITEDGTAREPDRQPAAADQAEREIRRYLSRWVPWAAIYALGFLVLWATGLSATQAFYVWAIGWALVWGAWVHADYVRRYLRPGRGRRSDRGNG